MEIVNVLAFVGGWLLLGILANRFGHDSRDGLSNPPTGPIWQLPADPLLPPSSRRPRRSALPGWTPRNSPHLADQRLAPMVPRCQRANRSGSSRGILTLSP